MTENCRFLYEATNQTRQPSFEGDTSREVANVRKNISSSGNHYRKYSLKLLLKRQNQLQDRRDNHHTLKKTNLLEYLNARICRNYKKYTFGAGVIARLLCSRFDLRCKRSYSVLTGCSAKYYSLLVKNIKTACALSHLSRCLQNLSFQPLNTE